MNKDIVDYALVFRADLHEMPPEIVLPAAHRHLEALRELEPGTADREKAISDFEEFLAEHADPAPPAPSAG